MKFPIHFGQCRCGKPRGHEDPCYGEIDPVIVDLNDRPRYSPWHALRDRLVERYGEELGNFLAKRIGKTMKNKDCIDQFSVVEIPSRFWHFFMPSFYIAWGRHRGIREGGCCGSFDDSIIHFKTGRIFTWGFNYGH